MDAIHIRNVHACVTLRLESADVAVTRVCERTFGHRNNIIKNQLNGSLNFAPYFTTTSLRANKDSSVLW